MTELIPDTVYYRIHWQIIFRDPDYTNFGGQIHQNYLDEADAVWELVKFGQIEACKHYLGLLKEQFGVIGIEAETKTTEKDGWLTLSGYGTIARKNLQEFMSRMEFDFCGAHCTQWVLKTSIIEEVGPETDAFLDATSHKYEPVFIFDEFPFGSLRKESMRTFANDLLSQCSADRDWSINGDYPVSRWLRQVLSGDA